jgi:hypothetical protein
VALAALAPRLCLRSAVAAVDVVPRPRRARPDGPDGVEEPKPSSGVKPNPTRLTNSPLIVRPVDSVASKRRSFAPAVAGAATATRAVQTPASLKQPRRERVALQSLPR